MTDLTQTKGAKGTAIEPKVGMVVLSRMGRDRGKHLMVTALIDPEFVEICDGKYRKLGAPKRKRWKHLVPTGKTIETIATKLIEGKKVFDSELYSALREI